MGTLGLSLSIGAIIGIGIIVILSTILPLVLMYYAIKFLIKKIKE